MVRLAEATCKESQASKDLTVADNVRGFWFRTRKGVAACSELMSASNNKRVVNPSIVLCNQEPTAELLGHLNYDFRLYPSLLHAVAKLHTGSLIADKDVIFAMTAEAYGRAKPVDIHGETSMKSFPSPSNCLYGSLSLLECMKRPMEMPQSGNSRSVANP